MMPAPALSSPLGPAPYGVAALPLRAGGGRRSEDDTAAEEKRGGEALDEEGDDPDTDPDPDDPVMGGEEGGGCRLYLITPPVIADLTAFADTLARTLDAGDVACLQLRLKGVGDDAICRAVDRLRPIAQAREVAVLMNDRPDLARKTGCDGVHIGQDDTPYATARRIVGDEAIVGVTCHDSRHLAMIAGEAGADYVAFGAFFPTATKEAPTRADPALVRWWAEMMVVPQVAIGGITVDTAPVLIAAGADFLAVSAGVWAYPEGPVAAVQAFNRLFAGQ